MTYEDEIEVIFIHMCEQVKKVLLKQLAKKIKSFQISKNFFKHQKQSNQIQKTNK